MTRHTGKAEWFPKRTLGMLPAEATRRWGAREALVFKDQRWTYSEFDAEVDRVARALIAIGVAQGEHVAIWIPNRPQFLFLFFAIVKIGAVVVPLNTRYRTLDLDYALRQCNAATLVTVDRSGPIDYAGMVREVVGAVEVMPKGRLRSAKCPELQRVVVLDQGDAVPGAVSWPEFLAGQTRATDAELAARAAAVEPDHMAIIGYTSGTTGNPKGVMLGHVIIRLCVERAAVMGITQSDVQLNYLPLFHFYGLAYIGLHSILTGAKHVLTETFNADESLQLIEREGVTTLHGFDTHFRDLMDAKKRSPSINLTSLRVAHYSAGLENVAAVGIEAQRELCPTVAGYGMTETGTAPTQTFLDANLDQRTRASGYPLPDVEIRIIDPETGQDAPPGTQGEILVRTYSNMLGYYNQPEATAEAIDSEGWLHTGDAGLIRPDGHLRFVGRYKDMLKVGGENVSPAEVESLLLQIPGVAQVAVVGCPDPRLNEVAAVFAVLDAGASLTQEAVEFFCRGKIASYKIPRRVIVVDSLPMTSSGKVQKHLLRQRLV